MEQSNRIDLGTNKFCVAAMEGGVPVSRISNAEGGRTTPSIVAFAKMENDWLRSSKTQAVTNESYSCIRKTSDVGIQIVK